MPARLLLALPIAALMLSFAACGGPSRPSADDVADGIQEIYEDLPQHDLVTDPVALCFAEALVDSDVSDETLASIADGEDKPKKEDEAMTTKILQDKQKECFAAE
ncbi:hypothetical protein [Microbacterium sp. PMB16]|uniref:hypothetical protein n=1 Tax=Microbacterium sp. PMB16 TaxID=3120157 RepID=UPI003F4C86F9